MYSVVLMMALSGGAEVPASHGCHGCWGGGSCHGCWGGGSGCWGSGHGCRGGCWGGGHGCWGSGHGCRGGCHGFLGHRHGCNGGCHGNYSSCCGCYGGGYACYGSGYGCHGGAVMPAGEPVKAPAPKTSMIAAPATIVVSLPAEAQLLIDDAPTKATSTTRVFSSPALEPGKEYVYTLKAELNQNGKPVTTTKVVTVRAGQETRVTMDLTELTVSAR